MPEKGGKFGQVTVPNEEVQFIHILYTNVSLSISSYQSDFPQPMVIFIDREAREIMYLVASVRLSVRLSPLSRLNRWYVCLSSVGVCG